jgi:hypothetical protein
MAMTLQQAIDYAIAPTDPTPYGLEAHGVISMHDDAGTVMVGAATFPNFTFRPDLPLLNWGPATIRRGGLVGGWLGPAQVPGFSTRGQGGMNLNMGLGSGTAMPIDLSVRRDPGHPSLSFLGLGPSVHIEIDKLSGAGTATDGVTLKAVENGALVRAVGPSVHNPASNASYTFTILVWARIG